MPHEQYKNIRKLIELYEKGQASPNKEVWILEGEVVDEETALESPGWAIAGACSSKFSL